MCSKKSVMRVVTEGSQPSCCCRVFKARVKSSKTFPKISSSVLVRRQEITKLRASLKDQGRAITGRGTVAGLESSTLQKACSIAVRLRRNNESCSAVVGETTGGSWYPHLQKSQNERKSANSSKGNRPTTDSFNSSC
jgi:hypothetical protein